jgi:phage-related protein
VARVFISHSSRDREQAGPLHDWLRNHGFVEAFLERKPRQQRQSTMRRQTSFDTKKVISTGFSSFVHVQFNAFSKTVRPLRPDPVTGAMAGELELL